MAQSDEEKGMGAIRSIYEEKKMTIDGRDYIFTDVTHAKRKKVFAFMSEVQSLIEVHNFSWMDGQRFDGIEETLGGIILFEERQISKIKDHWEKYPGDYIRYIVTAMQVLSYPFMAGSN